MQIKRRTFVKILSFCFGALAVTVGVFLSQRQLHFEDRRMTHTWYLRQTGELAQNTEKIAEALEGFALAENAEEKINLSFDICELCCRSTESLTDLPISDYEVSAMQSFYNKTENYVRSLCFREITDSEKETLFSLRNYADRLAQPLYELNDDLFAQKSAFSDLKTPQMLLTPHLCFSCKAENAGERLEKLLAGMDALPEM